MTHIHFSKGQVVHRLKSRANDVAKKCREESIKYKITKLKEGYRVDRERR